MDALKRKIHSFKNAPGLIFGGGCLLLPVFSVLLVYYVRVIYSPRWLGQIKGTAAVFARLCVLTGAWLAAKKRAGENTSLFLAVLLFVLGAVFSFATPPFQAPDENTHFLRGYQMAQGQWGFDENHQFPDDVNLMYKHFPAAHNNGYPAKIGNTFANRFEEYFDALKKGEKAENAGIIIFQVIPYIPLRAGIAARRAAGFGALGAFYAGRLANVLFFSVCAYFALKIRGRFKILMFSLMATPLMAFMYGSCNSDGVLFALMFLMFGCILAENFDLRKLLVFALCLAVLTTCKRTYIVFILLPLAVDREKWQVNFKDKKMGRVAALALCTACLLAVYFGMSAYVAAFSNYGEIERTMEHTDAAAQLLFIIRNPLRYASVFFDTLLNNSFFLFSMGLLGWIDVNLPLVNYTAPLLLIFCAFEQAGKIKKEDRKKIAFFLACSLLTYGVVMTGLYLSWTPVTLPQIIGLQMRYFYPAFMGFCLGVAWYFSRRTQAEKPGRDRLCAGCCYAFTLISAALMLTAYYLPRKAVVFVA